MSTAFTLWLPQVELVLFDAFSDYAIKSGGRVCAWACGNCIGVVGIGPVHRIGRRDA